MNALILGCGYLGRRVAGEWLRRDWNVTALTRSEEQARSLRADGVTPMLGDVTQPRSLQSLPAADVLLYAVGYDRSGEPSKREVSVDGLRNVLAEIFDRVGRIVSISSSSVYGQENGEWVDENSVCEPETESGRICLAAEHVVGEYSRSGRSGDATIILRLAGLYGPGRLIARAERLRAREAIGGRPDAWLNLIHVEDAARCVVAAAEQPSPNPLYLVSDDRPVRREEFYREAARLLSAPPPQFDPDSSTGQRTRGLGKRCRNDLMHCDLVAELRYPEWTTGLASALAERKSTFRRQSNV